MLSDGELDEGSNWEAILFAPHHRLDNLAAIVDYNKIQSLGSVKEVLDLHPLAEKFRAFNWAVKEIDGHDHAAIRAALSSLPVEAGQTQLPDRPYHQRQRRGFHGEPTALALSHAQHQSRSESLWNNWGAAS